MVQFYCIYCISYNCMYEIMFVSKSRSENGGGGVVWVGEVLFGLAEGKG